MRSWTSILLDLLFTSYRISDSDDGCAMSTFCFAAAELSFSTLMKAAFLVRSSLMGLTARAVVSVAFLAGCSGSGSSIRNSFLSTVFSMMNELVAGSQFTSLGVKLIILNVSFL